MTTPNESRIEYVDGPIRGAKEGWADSVPRGLGYDADDERLLGSCILQVRQLSAKSAAEHFSCDDNEFMQGVDSLIRVDYETWSTSNEFNPEAPEQVIYRREHVYVMHSDLLAEEDFCNHGMGRDCEINGYALDEEKEGSPEEVQLPANAREGLQLEIESEQREVIAEWLDGDVDKIPAGLGEVMQVLYEEIAEETRQEQDAAEQQAQAKAKQE
ncbi:hypothetical protein [Polaromonas sp. CG9_12]|nr:hypothetical protein [Polaromonas sp. CG9_12]